MHFPYQILIQYNNAFSYIKIKYMKAGYLAFSADTRDFRSFGVAFVSLFKSLTGGLDYYALEASNRAYGPLFYILFQVRFFIFISFFFYYIILWKI